MGCNLTHFHFKTIEFQIFLSNVCMCVIMISIKETITNEATITGQKSVHDGNAENNQKEKLKQV